MTVWHGWCAVVSWSFSNILFYVVGVVGGVFFFVFVLRRSCVFRCVGFLFFL